MFLPGFKNEFITQRHDSAVLPLKGINVAFTTDSYVVNPLFFPGGDIGSLSVYGTVNDLAMSGARPMFLSLGLIIEEGLDMQTLWKVVQSIREAGKKTGIQIVTGDTKVVDKGKGDQLFINTSGIGLIEHGQTIGPSQVQPGDLILLSGDIGRHGIAIMAIREGLEFETSIESDSAPLSPMVLDLLSHDVEIHCMRDLTRGGLASALNEISRVAHRGIMTDEKKIPFREDVKGACEILGFDPLYVANEGRFVAFVPPRDAERALAVMRSHPLGKGASIIGWVEEKSEPLVKLKSSVGTTRLVEMLSGEQLPRIC
jgi:hydrogenase expression/formation protein HypE